MLKDILKKLAVTLCAGTMLFSAAFSVSASDDETAISSYDFSDLTVYLDTMDSYRHAMIIGGGYDKTLDLYNEDNENPSYIQLCVGRRQDANASVGWYGTVIDDEHGVSAEARIGSYVSAGRGPKMNFTVPQNVFKERIGVRFDYYPKNGGNTADLILADPLSLDTIEELKVGGQLADQAWHKIDFSMESDRTYVLRVNGKITAQGTAESFTYPQLQFTQVNSNDASSAYIDNVELYSGGKTQLTAEEIIEIHGTDISSRLVINGYSTGNSKTIPVYDDINLMTDFMGLPLSWSAYEADGSACDRVTVSDSGFLSFNKERYSTEPITLKAQNSGSGISGETVIIPSLAFEEEDNSEIIDAEKYAVLMYAGIDGSGAYMVKLFTQDGEIKEYKLASTVRCWMYNNSYPMELSGSDKLAILNMKYLQTSVNGERCNIPLCKFKLNANGKVAQLYMAAEYSSSYDDEDEALRVDTINLRNMSGRKKFINGHLIKDGIIGFKIPSDMENFGIEEAFSVFKVNSSDYVNAEGVGKDFVLGEFGEEGILAGILVEFVTPKQEYDITDYNTAGDNVCGLVKSVKENANGTYTITGGLYGKTFSYITDEKACLYKLDKDNIIYSKDRYNADMIWTAGGNGGALTELISPGDVIGFQIFGGRACVMIKMVDVKELAKYAAAGGGDQYIGSSAFSDTRDKIGIGKISEIKRIDEGVLAATPFFGHFFDDDSDIQVVNVTTDSEGLTECRVENGICSPYDLTVFSGAGGDILFSRDFKGNEREKVIYRFNSASPEMYDSLRSEELPYEVNEIKITDASGAAYNSIPASGSFIVNVDVTENHAYSGNVYIVAAGYDENDSLVTFNYMLCAPVTYQRLVFGVNMQPGDKKIKKVKAFVWDELGSMTPLSKTAEIISK